MARVFIIAFALIGSVLADELCHSKPDGTLVPDPKSKTDFYECNNGMAFKLHCPTGLIFEEAAHGCVNDPNRPTEKIPCLSDSKFDCTGKPDGFYIDSDDRTKFHECDHHCPYDFHCPPLTYFEPSKNVCVFDKDNHEHTTMKPEVTTHAHEETTSSNVPTEITTPFQPTTEILSTESTHSSNDQTTRGRH